MIFALIDVCAAAVTASSFTLPALVFKVFASAFLIGELAEELESADRFWLFFDHEPN